MGTLKSGVFPNPLTIDQKNRHVTKVTEKPEDERRFLEIHVSPSSTNLQPETSLLFTSKHCIWMDCHYLYPSSDLSTNFGLFYHFWIRIGFPKWNEWFASFSSVPPNIPSETVFLSLHFITESALKYISPFSWSSHKPQMSHLYKNIPPFLVHKWPKYAMGCWWHIVKVTHWIVSP